MLAPLLLILACGGPPSAPEVETEPTPPAPPRLVEGAPVDILLVTIDTLRADRVGCYGDPLARTPAIDALAAHGALFREAQAVTPLTLPSHASILTGLLPARHGLRDNAGFRLPESVSTLAEALTGAGYATGAFVSAYVLDSAWGLDQGFSTYKDDFDPEELKRVGAFGEVSRPGSLATEAALAWWAAAPAPRFAWVHLFEPHSPYQPGPSGTGDPYRAEVTRADMLVGRLVEAVGEGALVAVTSDHGEGLWDHGEREHGLLLGRSATRVPMILRPPGGLEGQAAPTARPGLEVAARPSGADPALDLRPVPDAPRAARVIEGAVSGVDVAPTLAAWAGVALPGVDGRSLAAAVLDGAEPVGAVYAETFVPTFHYGWSSLQMAQAGPERLEVGLWSRLYDWTADPGGRTDLDRSSPSLEAAIARGKGEGLVRPGPITPETAQALASLGYLTESAPVQEPTDDPRDKVAGMQAEAAAAAAAGPKDPITGLREMIAREPQMVNPRATLATVLEAQGDLRGALDALRGLLEIAPEHPLALAQAADLARRLDDADQAVALARRLQALNPHDPRGYLEEARMLASREDREGVRRVTAAGLAAAPGDPELCYLGGLAAAQLNDLPAALLLLEEARERGAPQTDLDLWVGVVQERMGHIEEADAAYALARAARPGDLRPVAMPARMWVEAKRCDRARPLLDLLVARGRGGDAPIKAQLALCPK